MKSNVRATFVGLAMAVMAAGSLVVRADEKAVAASTPFLRASIGSTKQVQKLMADVGFPLPVDVQGLVERQFGFIGKGGLEADRPLGIAYLAGEDLPEKQRVVFGFPVNADVATVEKLVEQGFTSSGPELANKGDLLSFKRTANYLFMFAGGVDGVKDYGDGFFSGDYKSKDTLAFLTMDLAGARAAAPKAYDEFWKSIEAKQKAPANENEKRGYDAGMKFMREKIGGLDRMTVTLSQVEGGLRFNTWLMPVEIKGSRVFPQPAFPEGTIVTTHIAYPNEKMSHWIPELVDIVDFASVSKAGKTQLTAEEGAKMKALLTRLMTLWCAPDAQSIGLTVNNGEPLGLVVNQYVKDVDFGKEMAGIVENSNALAKMEGDGEPLMELKGYTGAKGASVTRARLIVKGKTVAFVDYVQKGRTVYMTVSAKETEGVEALAALPADGEMKALLKGSLDLSGMAKLRAIKDGPMAPEPLQKLADQVAGKQITWTVQNSEKEKYLYVAVTVPTAVLKAGSDFVKRSAGGPQGGAGDGRAQ